MKTWSIITVAVVLVLAMLHILPLTVCMVLLVLSLIVEYAVFTKKGQRSVQAMDNDPEFINVRKLMHEDPHNFEALGRNGVLAVITPEKQKSEPIGLAITSRFIYYYVGDHEDVIAPPAFSDNRVQILGELIVEKKKMPFGLDRILKTVGGGETKQNGTPGNYNIVLNSLFGKWIAEKIIFINGSTVERESGNDISQEKAKAVLHRITSAAKQ